MRRLALAAVLCLFPAAGWAQNNETLPPACSTTTLALGTCAPAVEGTRVRLTDGADEFDCTGGSGSTVHICEYDGTSWVDSPLVPMSMPIVFCGQGANADDNFLGPMTALGQELIPGNVACDALDSTTEATADAVPASLHVAYNVVGMVCSMTDVGTDDTVSFTLQDDTADTAATCTVTLNGAGTETCSTSVSHFNVAADSAVAIEQTRSDNDDLSTSDAICYLFVRF